jgi:hypothetical protein
MIAAQKKKQIVLPRESGGRSSRRFGAWWGVIGLWREKREHMNTVMDKTQLLKMSQVQLDELFAKSPSGPIPNGPADGTALIASGTTFSREIAEMINIFAWKGKVFDAEHGRLTNRISPFGVNAIVAEVYKGPSLLDKQECIVLDYSKTSFVAHWIRDEIRLIGPEFYLGRVYWDDKPLIHFSLAFKYA